MDKYSQKVLAELEDVDVNQASISSQPESNKLLDTAKTVGEFMLDITPVIGDIKGAIEYEDDIKMARGLWEMGYDEGSITQMGMGAGLAAMATLGLIPVFGMGADVGRAALKPAARAMAREMDEPLGTVAKQMDEPTPSVSEQTEDVFMPEFRKEQIEEAKKLPASERRKFLKEVNRPTPKVFHGARSISSTPKNLIDKQNDTANQLISSGVQEPTHRLYTNPETDMIENMYMSMDDIVDKQGIGQFSIPVKQANGDVDVVDVAFVEGESGMLKVHPMNTDTLEVDEDIVLGHILSDGSEQGKSVISYSRFSQGLANISSNLSTEVSSVTRRDRLVEEGFSPFSDFRGEAGLSGSRASGKHAEFRKIKALSTSRDPLVSMKPGFGGTNPENVVYADLPSGATKDLSAVDYDKGLIGDDLPELEQGQIGYRLPKSIHLEAEEAILIPENLSPKALVDNPELLAKVKEGQKKVQEILSETDAAATLAYVEDLADLSPAAAKKAYNLVRDKLNKLQSLGAYTEQYGARGTYDDLLETLLDDDKMPIFHQIIFEMPQFMKGNTQIKNNMLGLREVLLRIKQQSMQGARSKTVSSLRDIPDSLLEKAVYGGGKGLSAADRDALDGASIFLVDGKPDLSAKSYNDLKRILMLGTKKLNKGGLVSRR